MMDISQAVSRLHVVGLIPGDSQFERLLDDAISKTKAIVAKAGIGHPAYFCPSSATLTSSITPPPRSGASPTTFAPPR